jgi:BirA family biotin operon repressor/biotin-[acetyl-CoA-carboxylase] ligase
MSDDLESAVRAGRVAYRSLGHPAQYHATCRSTNDLALDMAEAGAPHGTVIVADRQTAGRGRRGHTWFSPPGLSVYASLVLIPADEPIAPTLLVAAVGLGLAEGLDESLGVPAVIKWPNDVWARGRKVAGVLVEARGYGAAPRALVAGFGVNVNHAEHDFPEHLVDTATSVALLTGRRHDRGVLLAHLLRALERRIDQACLRRPQGGLEAAYRERSLLLGRRVELLDGATPVVGTVADLSATEGLLLRTDAGAHVHVRAEHARDVRLAS